MARGVPLTPEQLEEATTVYARTGNYSAAAEAIGATISGTRRALIRRGQSTRVQLHTLACARGLREARKQVQRVAAFIERVLTTETNAGVSLEPKDIAALANALSKMTDTRINLADREDRRKSQQATRAKTKAETAAIRTNAPTGDISLIIAVEGDPLEVQADAPPGRDPSLPE